MGALASLTKWIPEDDLLLKNAVEAGASLESLAKGAVLFSRRFSIRELRDRWRSLLYDLDTSVEASDKILELEIDHGAFNHPKANRAYTYKGKESFAGKLKRDSVQSHYYAMRKRIRSEPCSAELGFLLPPASHVCSDSGSADQLNPYRGHPVDSFTGGIPILSDYGHPETVKDNDGHALRGIVAVESAAADGIATNHTFHTRHVDAAENDFPDGIRGRNPLYGYTENISSASVDEAGCHNGDQSFEHNYVSDDFPNILGENLLTVDISDVGEIRSPNALAASDRYENDVLGRKPLSSFDSTNDNRDGICTDFVGTDNLNSHVPDYSSSYHQLGYSSPPSGLPIWSTIEDISTPNMPLHGEYGGKEQGVHAVDDIKLMDASGCDGATLEHKPDGGICGAGLDNPPIIPGNDFIDFPDTYMDFASEDLLFIDEDEKGGLNSISLNSPCKTHHDVVANSGDLKATELLGTGLVNHNAACAGLSTVTFHELDISPDIACSASVSGDNVSSTTQKTSHTVKPIKEFMICVLNTHDTEVPNNDHVVFLAQPTSPYASSNLEQCSRESVALLSSKVLATDCRATVGDLNKDKEEQSAIVQANTSVLKSGSFSLPKVGSLHSFNGCTVEAELRESDRIAGVPIHASLAVDHPISCKPATAALNSAAVASFKEESTALGFQKHGDPDALIESLLENQLEGSDHAKLYPLTLDDGCKQERDRQATLQISLPSHADVVSAEMGLSASVPIMSTSDQDRRSDSENDAPNFSDIEAMILDMDLGPYDQEPCLMAKEVSKYQRMDTKKAIVRLEQGAHAYMNRAISSHGAFAVFYGRHLKYFIKDPEVSLGRATEDIKVDIDLGKEGRANKISRRQAIIRMNDDGSFFLKNIGKFSIFVNSKEVPAKNCINLLSGSVVEIRDMNFIFKVNESAVRHYINRLRGCNQEHNTRFTWKPDQNP